MKKTATIVLNRNLPDVTDKLVDHLARVSGEVTDIYIVESGSRRENHSKHATWWANWEEVLEYGLRYPRGFNYGLVKLLEEGKYSQYDYFFLTCNDVEFKEQPVIQMLEEEMLIHKRVGLLSPCSPQWAEKQFLKDAPTKYFWHISNSAVFMRRECIDSIREYENPTYMNFLYDGSNFRGYESDSELIAKAYINNWAAAITVKVLADENKSHLINKSDLIKTEPYEESLRKCVEEGKRWMRRKYGFNSRWTMQMYVKFFYDQFFEYYPELKEYKI